MTLVLNKSIFCKVKSHSSFFITNIFFLRKLFSFLWCWLLLSFSNENKTPVLRFIQHKRNCNIYIKDIVLLRNGIVYVGYNLWINLYCRSLCKIFYSVWVNFCQRVILCKTIDLFCIVFYWPLFWNSLHLISLLKLKLFLLNPQIFVFIILILLYYVYKKLSESTHCGFAWLKIFFAIINSNIKLIFFYFHKTCSITQNTSSSSIFCLHNLRVILNFMWNEEFSMLIELKMIFFYFTRTYLCKAMIFFYFHFKYFKGCKL